MANIVFVIGAGASAQGGCPVMGNFFKCAHQLNEHNNLGPFSVDYDLVQQVRRELCRAKEKCNIDTDNLESIFNALEMGELLGRLGSLERNDIANAKRSFVRLICGVLERTQQCYQSRAGDSSITGMPNVTERPAPRLCGPVGHDDLARLINAIVRSNARNNVSIITFNYDVGIEVALKLRGIYPVSGLDDNEKSDRAVQVPVYKMHGSMHWMSLDRGTKIVADNQLIDNVISEVAGSSAATVTLPVTSAFEKRALAMGADSIPYIVPPSENKQANRFAVANMWRKAADAIGHANVMCVVGYSMPETDVFFRQFYAIAASTLAELRLFFVFDPDSKVGDRFRQLVGMPSGHCLVYRGVDYLNGMHQMSHYYAGNGMVF